MPRGAKSGRRGLHSERLVMWATRYYFKAASSCPDACGESIRVVFFFPVGADDDTRMVERKIPRPLWVRI